MMYGTRKEINRLMKRAFTREEKLAVLIWTAQDVMAQAEDMTEQEADAILNAIGNVGLGKHMEEGISVQTVGELLASLRAGSRTVTLDAWLLERVTRTAERALVAEDGAAWDAGAGTPHTVRDALNDITRVRALLAA
ncbi:DUF1380 domain-containing protein (plasmid) [Erwinia billingiae]|uniref:DUF1380 family protein n=1 Tax=Erwinia billingiae TaxID=182337 RepID=UPI0012491F8D|nr:DUF1380 family protein [Erwinia billingiae]QEW34553.1 DUF1380 domain-containing protein [Erwinia billingiae]